MSSLLPFMPNPVSVKRLQTRRDGSGGGDAGHQGGRGRERRRRTRRRDGNSLLRSVLNLRASSQILRWKMINCVTLDNSRQAAHGRGVLIDRRDSIRGGGGGGATAAASTPDGGWSRPKWTLRFHADTSLHFGAGTDQVAPVSFLFELLDRPSFFLWKKVQSLGEFHFVFAWKVRLR